MWSLVLCTLFACASEPDFDVIVRGGLVYDGLGGVPRRLDVGVRGDRIVTLADLSGRSAVEVIDARGLAVAPGFINMLSWATESLIHDGRSMGDILQGVTTEIFGEGQSVGPYNDQMARRSMGEGFLGPTIAALGEPASTRVISGAAGGG